MNAREQARNDALKRVGTFGTNNAADFNTPVPPSAVLSPGQAQAKQLFADISMADTGLIARVAQTAEAQQAGSGEAASGATSKEVLKHALLLELKGINRTAAAIAEATENPALMDKFRMPYGVGEAVLIAKATAIADVAEGMATEFVAYGHDADFADDLRARIEAYDGADTTKETGLQTQAGATGELEPLLKDGMKKVRQLDAFIHNFYKNNPEKLAEWHTASHVERQPKKKKDETPANPPPPTP